MFEFTDLHLYNIEYSSLSLVPNNPFLYGAFATGNKFYGVTYDDIRIVNSSDITQLTYLSNIIDGFSLDDTNLRFSELIKNESYLLVGSSGGLHILQTRPVIPRLLEVSVYATGDINYVVTYVQIFLPMHLLSLPIKT